MSLKLRINLLITVLTVLFTGAVVKIVIDDTRRAIREEMEGSNRVTLQLLTTESCATPRCSRAPARRTACC